MTTCRGSSYLTATLTPNGVAETNFAPALRRSFNGFASTALIAPKDCRISACCIANPPSDNHGKIAHHLIGMRRVIGDVCHAVNVSFFTRSQRILSARMARPGLIRRERGPSLLTLGELKPAPRIANPVVQPHIDVPDSIPVRSSSFVPRPAA